MKTKWEHLQTIEDKMPDLLNYNFGLLLEYNCAQALTSREVDIGKSTKP